jgi:hypothetical protein
LLAGSRLTRLDEPEIIAKAATWRDKIFAADHDAN